MSSQARRQLVDFGALKRNRVMEKSAFETRNTKQNAGLHEHSTFRDNDTYWKKTHDKTRIQMKNKCSKKSTNSHLAFCLHWWWLDCLEKLFLIRILAQYSHQLSRFNSVFLPRSRINIQTHARRTRSFIAIPHPCTFWAQCWLILVSQWKVVYLTR